MSKIPKKQTNYVVTRQHLKNIRDNITVTLLDKTNPLWDYMREQIYMNSLASGTLCAQRQVSGKILPQSIQPSYIKWSLGLDLKSKPIAHIKAIIVAIVNNIVIGFYTLHANNKKILKLDAGCVDLNRRGKHYGLINAKLSKVLNNYAISQRYQILALQGLPDAESSWIRQGFQRVDEKNLLNYTQSKSKFDKNKQKEKINAYSKNIGHCENERNGCWMFKEIM
jgi:hypothetical protein